MITLTMHETINKCCLATDGLDGNDFSLKKIRPSFSTATVLPWKIVKKNYSRLSRRQTPSGIEKVSVRTTVRLRELFP